MADQVNDTRDQTEIYEERPSMTEKVAKETLIEKIEPKDMT